MLATAVARPQGWADVKPWSWPRMYVTLPRQQKGGGKNGAACTITKQSVHVF